MHLCRYAKTPRSWLHWVPVARVTVQGDSHGSRTTVPGKISGRRGRVSRKMLPLARSVPFLAIVGSPAWANAASSRVVAVGINGATPGTANGAFCVAMRSYYVSLSEGRFAFARLESSNAKAYNRKAAAAIPRGYAAQPQTCHIDLNSAVDAAMKAESKTAKKP